ncbi:Anaerobic regulatory protein [Paenibacillus sp. CECT 9249]|uniref:Crp/Fnr family transcriptional regulator n=1 Tax=Paenibacillus sp. CECT 9249 TaxID=2845385 RepID=UPI001E28C1BB|nr:Crp/Fnr family transcriptional regulator [Paenibacillus sp. CECT 9249]CAH0117793.1 Anaerobic regulatory protein [Paenibacillus sp. CECT 9249]
MRNMMPLLPRSRNTDCFSDTSIRKLQEAMLPYRAGADGFLFTEGEPATKAFYIETGRVNLTKASDDGKELVFFTFREGDLVGQIEPFRDTRQSFNAKPSDNSLLGIVDKKDIEALLLRHGDFAVEFMKWMGRMHALTQNHFVDLLHHGNPGALCSALLRLSNLYGTEHENGIRISEKMAVADLAAYIGATGTSASKMLEHLRQEQIISYESGYIVLKDLDYLRKGCHCEHCPEPVCRISR